MKLKFLKRKNEIENLNSKRVIKIKFIYKKYKKIICKRKLDEQRTKSRHTQKHKIYKCN